MRSKKPSLKPAIPPSKPARSAGANQPNPKTERPAPAAGADKTAEYWAPRINQHLIRSVSSLIDVGHELSAAKARLPHGEWQRLFDTKLIHLRGGHPDPCRRGGLVSAARSRAAQESVSEASSGSVSF